MGLVGVGLAALGVGAALSSRGGGEVFGEVMLPSTPGEPASNLVVSTTALGDNEAVICLVDRARQRLMVYVADVKRSRLKLLAVRDISADWALTDWNNDPPLPKDIRARVEKSPEAPRPGAGAGSAKPEASP